jgi:UDP-N-acetylglucosamine--N-acetylmuramyl-(pentapeptide) pyrophosphoryl-undecaprenol N-acetylglucosamine transferase
MNAGTVVLATGGTGGHMFPAQALAGELQDRGYRVAVVTDARGMRHASFARDVTVHAVSAASVAGRGAMSQVGAVASLFRGMFQASRLLGELRPCVVVGFGGYPSIPAVAASIRRGIRTVIHEQNAVLGRANRLVARGVQAIGTSFEHTAAVPAAAAGKVTVVGNPVRPAIAAVREIAYRAPSPDGPFELLVVGGSQGATIMSKVVPTAIASLDGAAASRVRVVQQCRPEDMDDVRRIYRDAGVDARVATFVDDLPDRLATAHLVISRAGASTVSEIAVAGRPAILVPYPTHPTITRPRTRASSPPPARLGLFLIPSFPRNGSSGCFANGSPIRRPSWRRRAGFGRWVVRTRPADSRTSRAPPRETASRMAPKGPCRSVRNGRRPHEIATAGHRNDSFRRNRRHRHERYRGGDA